MIYEIRCKLGTGCDIDDVSI